MILKLDENNYVIGYACCGGIEGGIEVNCEESDIPYPHCDAYKYVDGEFILDQDKMDELVAEDNAPHLSEIDELKQRVAALEALLNMQKGDGQNGD